MAYVYILHSKQLDRYYIGSCLDLRLRLEQHLNHTFKDSYTVKANDWELFFHLDGLGYNQARLIEHHFKKMRNRKYYLNLKIYPEISMKLILKYRE